MCLFSHGEMCQTTGGLKCLEVLGATKCNWFLLPHFLACVMDVWVVTGGSGVCSHER